MILKAGRLTVLLPSLTRMTILLCTPAWVGVPLRRPVPVLKLAHDGLLLMLKLRLSPSASDAHGRKLYQLPAVAVLAGVPPMVGGMFTCWGDELLLLPLELDSWEELLVAVTPLPPLPPPPPQPDRAMASTSNRICVCDFLKERIGIPHESARTMPSL